jgi:hypothetical protein
MIISVKDKMYAVDFHHITQEPNRSTVCLIAPFDPNKKKPTFKEYFFSSGTSEPVIEGQAFCHENDQFCKATGRRLRFQFFSLKSHKRAKASNDRLGAR